MKAIYEKPALLVEEYELNTAVATGCQTLVDLGPEDHEYNGTYYTNCTYFENETFDSESPQTVNFWENECTCYLSSGDTIIFTS